MLARFRFSAVLLAILTTGVAMPSQHSAADEITEQLDLIDELYAAGDYGDMITELEFVLQEMRGRMSAVYAETFPEPPAGWTAEVPENNGGAGFMGGTMLSRTYREEGGDGRIEAQLMVDNPMVQGMIGLFANPQLLAAQPNAQRIRIGRDNAILTFEPHRASGEIMFLLAGRMLLQLKGDGLDNGDPLEDMLKAWDMDELKRLAGI